MNKITQAEIEDFINSKSLTNSQPYRSVLENYARLANSVILKDESVNELYERYIIGKSRSSAKFAKSVIMNFTDRLSTKQESPEFFEGKTQEKQTVSSEQMQEELRQKQELAKIQAEELAKTQAEAREEQKRILEVQKREQEEKAIIEAKIKKEAMEKRVRSLTEGFISQAIPDKYIQFDPVENIPTESTPYFEQANEIEDLEMALNYGNHVCLVGSAGTGKTEAVLNYGCKTQTPVYKYSSSADARKSDLIGSKTIDENQKIKFLTGMVTKAVLAGNQYGKVILLLDEGNTLIPKIQKLVNGITDKTRFIDLPEGKIAINRGVLFNVVITMNNKYSGTSPLNVELKDRFRFVEFHKLTKTTKQKIFAKYNVSQETKDQLIAFSDKVDKMQKESLLEEEVEYTTRSQKATLEDIENYEFSNISQAVKRALRVNFVAKFSDEIEMKKAEQLVNEYF